MGSAGPSGYHDEARASGPGLVVGRSGASFGKVHYCPSDYWPLNTALFATDFMGNDPRYAYYALKTLDLTTFNSGSAQASLNRNFIASIPIEIPPKAEQLRISSILAALDDKIDSNRRLAGLFEEAAAEIFRARFVDFAGVDEFEDSEIGDVPRGWGVGTLGDLATVSKQSVKPVESPDSLFEHFGILEFDAGRRPEIVPGAQLLSGKTLVPDRDCLLLSKLNPATRRVWWPRPTGRHAAITSPEFVVLVPRNGIPITYLYAVVGRDERFYGELLSHVSGTTGSRQRVKPDAALGCRTMVPATSELEEWDLVARPLYDRAAAATSESATLASVRDALLPKLISGEIRVPDIEDPAEVIEPAADGLGVVA